MDTKEAVLGTEINQDKIDGKERTALHPGVEGLVGGSRLFATSGIEQLDF